MSKTEALKMIDQHKNSTKDIVAMLHWTWLRVIIDQIPDKDWENYLVAAVEILAR